MLSLMELLLVVGEKVKGIHHNEIISGGAGYFFLTGLALFIPQSYIQFGIFLISLVAITIGQGN